MMTENGEVSKSAVSIMKHHGHGRACSLLTHEAHLCGQRRVLLPLFFSDRRHLSHAPLFHPGQPGRAPYTSSTGTPSPRTIASSRVSGVLRRGWFVLCQMDVVFLARTPPARLMAHSFVGGCFLSWMLLDCLARRLSPSCLLK